MRLTVTRSAGPSLYKPHPSNEARGHLAVEAAAVEAGPASEAALADEPAPACSAAEQAWSGSVAGCSSAAC